MLLGLLMCGQVAPAAQGPGGNYPELFASFFADHDVTLVRVDLDPRRGPGRSGRRRRLDHHRLGPFARQR
jgi:hypothetical protein